MLARLDSRRLPGKALAAVAGRPLLDYPISRVPAALLDQPLILATSARQIDDPLAEFGRSMGLAVYRGDAEDVAGRLVAAARTHQLDAVLRLNGDSPFVDPELVALAVSAFRQRSVDMVTNLQPRSAPYGVSAEVISVAALESCLAGPLESGDREHVTPVLYRSLPRGRIAALTPSDAGYPDYGDTHGLARLCLTIDEPEDLISFRNFVAALKVPWEAVRVKDAVESGCFSRRVHLPIRAQQNGAHPDS